VATERGERLSGVCVFAVGARPRQSAAGNERSGVLNTALAAVGAGIAAAAVALVLAAIGRSSETAIIAALITGPALFLFLTRRGLRRIAIDRTPFPEEWRVVLERYVAFYRRLGPEARPRFEREVRYFLIEHVITGPRGTAVPDELRVLVGACAAILAFGRPGYTWNTIRDVVIHEDSFDADDFSVHEQGELLGQVGAQGPIVLSARSLRAGFLGLDGHNVGLHELAHVLDFDDGRADGVPGLLPWRELEPWLRVMHDEVRKIEEHHSVLDQYGAKNEAEFFAVATETFFERPSLLLEKHPELYAMLSKVYGQDPARGELH
jgi:Mlc titration factor MtfA (ptsG expression regulator)